MQRIQLAAELLLPRKNTSAYKESWDCKRLAEAERFKIIGSFISSKSDAIVRPQLSSL